MITLVVCWLIFFAVIAVLVFKIWERL